MPLPAILSITIFGGMFLVISIHFYFKIKKQGQGYVQMPQKELIKQDLKQSNKERNNLTLGQQKTKEISSLPQQCSQINVQIINPMWGQNQFLSKQNQEKGVHEKYQTPSVQQIQDTKSQGCAKVDDMNLNHNQNNQHQTKKFQIEQSSNNQDTKQNNYQQNADKNISEHGVYEDKQVQSQIVNNHGNQEQSKIDQKNQLKKKVNSQLSTSNMSPPQGDQPIIQYSEHANAVEHTDQTPGGELQIDIIENEKKSSEEKVTPGEIQENVDEQVASKNELDSMKESQLISNSNAKNNSTLCYEKIQYLFLAISCATLVEAITGRVYVELNVVKIEFPQILLLAVISTAPTIIIFNLIEISIGSIFNEQSRIISRILFIFYGLVMGFPIYLGLDDFLQLEFISVLFTILFSTIIQVIFVYCKLINYTMFHQ